jgi:hypothetical protein
MLNMGNNSPAGKPRSVIEDRQADRTPLAGLPACGSRGPDPPMGFGYAKNAAKGFGPRTIAGSK